jgi:hypothetical protein
MNQFLATTPRSTSDRLLTAIRRACPNALPPVPLEVQSRHDAVPGRCYEAVERHLAEQSGEAVLGWVIWEHPGAMLIMEHHAVALCGGVLVDVALHLGGERRILFAPDPSSGTEHGRNRFAPLSASPLIARLVGLKRRNDDIEKEAGNVMVACGLPEWQRNHAEAGALLERFYGKRWERKEKKEKREQRKKRKRR